MKRLADALEAAGVKRRQQFATLVRDAQVNAKANQAGMPMPQAGMGSTIDHATGAPQAWPSLPEDEQHIGRQRGAGGEHWHSGEPEAAQHWYCGGEEGARGDPAPGASVVPVEYSGEADPLIGCHDGWHTPGPGMPPSVASDGTGWLSPIKGPGPRPSTAAADPSSSAAPLSDTDTVAALTRLRRENAALKKKLELHRQRTATLTSRVGRLEQELAARTDTPVVQPLGPLS